MLPPAFAPSFPVQGYPAPPPGPVVRAQAADEPAPAPRPAEPRPAPLRIPSPEQLGVVCTLSADNASPDWATVHRRLDLLGATCLHLEKLSQGGCRFTCLLPTT